MNNKREFKKTMDVTKEEIVACVALAGSAVLGYKVGRSVTTRQFQKGWNYLFSIDPSLKTHIWEAMGKMHFGEK